MLLIHTNRALFHAESISDRLICFLFKCVLELEGCLRGIAGTVYFLSCHRTSDAGDCVRIDIVLSGTGTWTLELSNRALRHLRFYSHGKPLHVFHRVAHIYSPDIEHLTHDRSAVGVPQLLRITYLVLEYRITFTLAQPRR